MKDYIKLIYTLTTILCVSCKTENKSHVLLENMIKEYQSQSSNNPLAKDIVSVLQLVSESDKTQTETNKDSIVVYDQQSQVVFVNNTLKEIKTVKATYSIKTDKLISVNYSYNKSTKKGELINGVYSGYYVVFDSLGYQETHLKDNDTMGYKSYYNNGKIRREITFKNFKRNGPCITYYNNGTKASEKNYENNHIIGLANTWFDNGKLQTKVAYVNGKKEGEELTYYKNVKSMAFKRTYKQGKLHGKQIAWFENTRVKHKVGFKDGKLNGEMELYQEDKKLMKMKGNYLNDLKNGEFLLWDETGSVIYSATYELGELKHLEKGKEDKQFLIDDLEVQFF